MSRAIVIGGSIAGMCAARALGEAFDEVTIIERDELPRAVAPRPGVPQSRHTHMLLPRGEREIEALFPGFSAALVAAGAHRFDVGTGMAVRRSHGWQTVGATGRDVLWASRDLIEGTIRALLRARTRITVRERAQVLGLRRAARGPIDGLTLRHEGGTEELAADLVVDASGRSTASLRWLEAVGVRGPEVRRVDAHAGYASRFYKAPPPERRPASWWWKGLWVESDPDRPRGGVIFPIEGDRWLVTASGFARNYPPTDEKGFLEHLASLSTPMLARAVALAEPLSSISGNRSMANELRAYDRWEALVPGFLAIGDAACAFNPVYGQGMAVAAVCAGILRDVLRAHGWRPGLERRFFREQGRFVRKVWGFATFADFKWPGTEGERPYAPAILTKYIKLGIESAHFDSALRRHIFPVIDLTGSMSVFFEPRVVAKVLTASAERRVRRRIVGPPLIPETPPQP